MIIIRDPNRLDKLYKTMLDIHKKEFPDWRFGQFMGNFFGWCVTEKKCNDIFFPEDNKWIDWLIEYAHPKSEYKHNEVKND